MTLAAELPAPRALPLRGSVELADAQVLLAPRATSSRGFRWSWWRSDERPEHGPEIHVGVAGRRQHAPAGCQEGAQPGCHGRHCQLERLERRFGLVPTTGFVIDPLEPRGTRRLVNIIPTVRVSEFNPPGDASPVRVLEDYLLLRRGIWLHAVVAHANEELLRDSVEIRNYVTESPAPVYSLEPANFHGTSGKVHCT